MAYDALTTLANCKLVLRINDTTQDSLLTMLVSAASQAITNSCNRPFFLSTNAANPITEYYSGSGDQWLLLNQWPVQSIASIYLDDLAYWGSVSGSFASTSLLVNGTDYALAIDQPDGTSRSAMVMRLDGVWDCQWNNDSPMLSSYPVPGQGNIKVMYTPGYTSLPDDLQYAATQVVARMYQASQRGQGINSEGYDGWSVALAANSSFAYGFLGGEGVSPILAKYRIMPIGVAV